MVRIREPIAQTTPQENKSMTTTLTMSWVGKKAFKVNAEVLSSKAVMSKRFARFLLTLGTKI
jgi:hypothetical protein